MTDTDKIMTFEEFEAHISCQGHDEMTRLLMERSFLMGCRSGARDTMKIADDVWSNVKEGLAELSDTIKPE